MSPKSDVTIDPAYLTPVRDVPDLERESDLGEHLSKLGENIGLIIAIVAAAMLAAVVYLLVAQPIYSVNAILQVEEQKSSLGAFEEVAEFFDAETPVNAEIEILRSRSVIGKAVDRLRLHTTATPRYFPIVGKALARRLGPHHELMEPWLGLLSLEWGSQFAWGGEAVSVETFNVPETVYGESFTLIAQGDQRFGLYDPENFLIAHGVVGTLLRVPYGDGNIALFVSELRARAGTHFDLVRSSHLATTHELQERLRVSEKGKQSGILQIRLEDAIPGRVTDIVNEIATIYLRQNVERKSAEAQKTLKFLEAQLPIVKEKLESAEAALNSFRLERGSVDLSKETQVVLEKIVTLEADLITLKQQREELLRRFTPAHPRVSALDAQIRRIGGELAELNSRIKGLPDTQQEVLRLSRDVEVNAALYTSLLNSAQELRVVKAGTVGNVRIIDHAVPPTVPIKPNKGFVLTMTFLLGICGAVVLVLVRRTMRDGVRDPDYLEKHLGLPVYATIPHSKAQEKIARKRRSGKGQVLAAQDPEDPAVESLRSLRTTLHFALHEAKSNVVMVTGACPGVGKSFVCVNFGVVLANAGMRVLLIDADLRKGYLNEALGLGRTPGLSDHIIGHVAIDEVTANTQYEGLDIIPTGAIPPNPSELLLHERFAQTLSAVSGSYDYVVVDSPPVLAVTDAAIVGRVAGATLLVVKAGAHPLRELEHSIKRLAHAGVNVRGMLFNDLTPSSGRYAYAYGGYGYAYSYKRS